MNSPSTPVRSPPRNYSNLNSLLRALGNRLHGYPGWAVGGSMAARLHHPGAREPRNIDLVVNRKNAPHIFQALINMGFNGNRPGPGSWNHVEWSRGRHKIDVLRAGGQRAPSLIGKVTRKGIPVINWNSLVNQKAKYNPGSANRMRRLSPTRSTSRTPPGPRANKSVSPVRRLDLW